MRPDPLAIVDQVGGRVRRQVDVRLARVWCALTAIALVEQDDLVHRRVEPPSEARGRARTRPAVEHHCRLAVGIAADLPVETVAGTDVEHADLVRLGHGETVHPSKPARTRALPSSTLDPWRSATTSPSEIALDCADGLFSRREAVRRLMLLGLDGAGRRRAAGIVRKRRRRRRARRRPARPRDLRAAPDTVPAADRGGDDPRRRRHRRRPNRVDDTVSGDPVATSEAPAGPVTEEIRFAGPRGELIGVLVDRARSERCGPRDPREPRAHRPHPFDPAAARGRRVHVARHRPALRGGRNGRPAVRRRRHGRVGQRAGRTTASKTCGPGSTSSNDARPVPSWRRSASASAAG